MSSSYWNFADDLDTEMVSLVVGSEHKTFVVHKSLLVNQCNYFRGALTSSLYKEAVEGVMRFEDESPSVVRLLVGYLYTKTIPQVQPFVRKPRFTPLPAKKQADSFPSLARPPSTIDTLFCFSMTLNDPHETPTRDRPGQVRPQHISAVTPKFSPEEIRLADYEAAVKRGLDPRDVRTWPPSAKLAPTVDDKKKRRQLPRGRREWLQRKVEPSLAAALRAVPKDGVTVISFPPANEPDKVVKTPEPRTPRRRRPHDAAHGAGDEPKEDEDEGSTGQGASPGTGTGTGTGTEDSAKPVGQGPEVTSVEVQKKPSSSPLGVLKALPLFTFRAKKPIAVGPPLSLSPMARARSKFFGGSAPGSRGKETADMSMDREDTASDRDTAADGDTAPEVLVGKDKKWASGMSGMPSFARSAASWAKSITAQATAEVQPSPTESHASSQQQQQDVPLFTFGGDAMDEDAARDPAGEDADQHAAGTGLAAGHVAAAAAGASAGDGVSFASSFCKKPLTVATQDWIGWLRDPRDPDFPTSRATFLENEKYQLDVLRLAVLAERLCWDQLFNAAVNAYLDGEERVMRRPQVALEHVDIAYNGGTYPGSPLRRLFSDMVHFEVKTSLTHRRYLDLAKESDDFLADLFQRLDLAVWSPGRSPFNTLKDPLRARRCLYHHHADWSSNNCF